MNRRKPNNSRLRLLVIIRRNDYGTLLNSLAEVGRAPFLLTNGNNLC